MDRQRARLALGTAVIVALIVACAPAAIGPGSNPPSGLCDRGGAGPGHVRLERARRRGPAHSPAQVRSPRPRPGRALDGASQGRQGAHDRGPTPTPSQRPIPLAHPGRRHSRPRSRRRSRRPSRWRSRRSATAKSSRPRTPGISASPACPSARQFGHDDRRHRQDDRSPSRLRLVRRLWHPVQHREQLDPALERDLPVQLRVGPRRLPDPKQPQDRGRLRPAPAHDRYQRLPPVRAVRRDVQRR